MMEGILLHYRTHYKKMTIQNMSKIYKWTFTAKEVQMTNKHMRRYSASFIITEIKIQRKKEDTIFTYQLAKLKKLVKGHG